MNHFVALLLIFILFVLTIILYMYLQNRGLERNNKNEFRQQVNMNNLERNVERMEPYYTNPNNILSTLPNDTFLNPYVPPMKQSHLSITSNIRNRNSVIGSPVSYPALPINVNTNRAISSYRQIGLLTRENGSEMILPIFGREIDTHRNKWNYYTMSENNTMVKLPISHKGRSCTNEYGCDELYNGDTVYVEGYKDIFRVTIYENNTLEYIP